MGQIGSAVYLAGSFKTAPRILIFSIAMGADYSFYVKFIATRAPTFFGYTVKLDFKELLIKEQIDFKELFTDYQLFYTINLLLNKELLPI